MSFYSKIFPLIATAICILLIVIYISGSKKVMNQRWTNDDIFWAAICVYHEARGEPQEARIAVSHVIFNRAEKAGETVYETIFKPKQFSWTNGGNRPPIKEYESLLNSIDDVGLCLSKRQQDEKFDDRRFFRDDSISTPDKAKNIIKIGRLNFFSY